VQVVRDLFKLARSQNLIYSGACPCDLRTNFLPLTMRWCAVWSAYIPVLKAVILASVLPSWVWNSCIRVRIITPLSSNKMRPRLLSPKD